ncbi:hypothetical protein A6770_04180 [Nostoc minutum NIES-26]|uniref:Uncharacterized protein n=1 Tax=Nostoc minutum NIES-26 TaxID=1844469 RepID=A0A367QDP0_9NOSO|nr:hypothetical protein A6770_04180 [Nostoc minutum NIES-26]
MADSTKGGNSKVPSKEVLIKQLERSPFAELFNIPNVDKEEVLEAFGKAFSDGGGKNPFPTGSGGTDGLPYNGNPFAGENFWDIFAGGKDPTKGPGDPLTGGGGGNPFGGSGNPFEGGDNPFGGGSNPFGGGSNPFGGSGNPFESGDNPFAGGGNPFGGSGNPFA